MEEYISSHDWGTFDNLIQSYVENNFQIFAVLAGGLNCDLPRFQGAVANPDRIGRQFYLGHIYLFAKATARRYGKTIKAFFIEDELNEAGLAALLGWREPCSIDFRTRRFTQTCWTDFNFLTELIKTLSQAVRQEAPKSLVGILLHTDIHDNFHKGLWAAIAGRKNFVESVVAWEQFGDIIGLDFFPNYYIADPVYFTDVGERIKKIKAVLLEKSVVVLETGYSIPKQSTNPYPVNWDEEKQAIYVHGAIESAVEAGADGFSYFNPEGLGCSPPPGGYTAKDLYALQKLGRAFRQGDTLAAVVAVIELGVDYLDARFRCVLQAAEGYGFLRPDGSKRPAYYSIQRWYREKIPEMEKAGFFGQTVYNPAPKRVSEGPALLQNFPNPFNPETWIPYQLAERSEVVIRIFGTDGKLVRTLWLGNKPVGLYLSKDKAAYWDGHNENGELMANGIYFYYLEASGIILKPRLMVILR